MLLNDPNRKTTVFSAIHKVNSMTWLKGGPMTALVTCNYQTHHHRLLTFLIWNSALSDSVLMTSYTWWKEKYDWSGGNVWGCNCLFWHSDHLNWEYCVVWGQRVQVFVLIQCALVNETASFCSLYVSKHQIVLEKSSLCVVCFHAGKKCYLKHKRQTCTQPIAGGTGVI